MTIWWYAKDEQRAGPISDAEILALRSAGTINDATLVWRSGWPEWKALGTVAELASQLPPPLPASSLAPPPLPVEGPPPLPEATTADNSDAEAVLSYPLAKKWRRYFARLFDIYLLSLPVGFAAGFVLAMMIDGFSAWAARPGSEYALGIVVLPVILVLESLLHQWFGSSPGKKLFGLRVVTLRGNALNFEQYLRRNFSLWVSGMALGIPLFNLVTYIKQGNRLERDQQTSYDEELGTRVMAQPISPARKMLAGVALVILVVVSSALTRAS